jgi:hypothetical protein
MVPAAVLRAFGLPGSAPVRLPGGPGGTWRAGDLVLRPAGSAGAAKWTADLFAALSGPGFDVERRVRSAAGDWVAGGWAAWQWLLGVPPDLAGLSPYWAPGPAVARRGFGAFGRAATGLAVR